MEKIKQYKYIILILLVVLGFSFYWYEYRPSIIKKECYEEAKEKAIKSGYSGRTYYYLYDEFYKSCLQKKGL